MHVAVLGAGLQGSCIAMELAAAGVSVDLYDRRCAALAGASLHNEGKVHLGFVYANEPSKATARLMVRGALAFAPLMRRWFGPRFDAVPVSTPFTYAVHRRSLLPPAEVAAHLEACRDIAQEEAGEGADYLGREWQRPARPLCPSELYSDAIIGAFDTPEIAIETVALAALVRDGISSNPDVRAVFDARVTSVSCAAERPVVHFEHGGAAYAEAYDQIVNALWDGRLAVDVTAGVRPAPGWLYRMKYFLRAQVATPLPSTTFVLGPFGDVVAYPGGHTYLSWYPAGMTGRSTALEAPCWPDTHGGCDAGALQSHILAGLAEVVPAVREESVSGASVHGGVIVATGAGDIDDPASGLHSRADIGVQSHGRYHTVSTGKLTTAPLFAVEAVSRVLNHRR